MLLETEFLNSNYYHMIYDRDNPSKFHAVAEWTRDRNSYLTKKLDSIKRFKQHFPEVKNVAIGKIHKSITEHPNITTVDNKFLGLTPKPGKPIELIKHKPTGIFIPKENFYPDSGPLANISLANKIELSIKRRKPFNGNKIDKEFKEHHHSMIPEERFAISMYSGSYSGNLNKRLLDDNLYPKDHDMANHISNGIQRNKAHKDFWVHAGVGFSPERFKPTKHGIKVHTPAYTSTTLNETVAEDFAKTDNLSKHKYDANHKFNKFDENNKNYSHTIHLKIPKDSHCSYIANISNHPGEHEVLLNKGSQFHINPNPKVNHVTGQVHWTGHLVHDGFKMTSLHPDFSKNTLDESENNDEKYNKFFIGFNRKIKNEKPKIKKEDEEYKPFFVGFFRNLKKKTLDEAITKYHPHDYTIIHDHEDANKFMITPSLKYFNDDGQYSPNAVKIAVRKFKEIYPNSKKFKVKKLVSNNLPFDKSDNEYVYGLGNINTPNKHFDLDMNKMLKPNKLGGHYIDNKGHENEIIKSSEVPSHYHVNHLSNKNPEQMSFYKLHGNLEKMYKNNSHLNNHSLGSYSENSTGINQYLIDSHKDSKKGIAFTDSDMDSDIHNISKVIQKYKTPNDFWVHSGIGFSPEKFNKTKYGLKARMPAFTSTSLHNGVAKTFSKIAYNSSNYAGLRQTIHIKVPEGSHGFYFGTRSSFSNEYEFLLHHGAKLHINPNPMIDKETKHVHWTAHLVHDGIEYTKLHPDYEKLKNSSDKVKSTIDNIKKIARNSRLHSLPVSEYLHKKKEIEKV